MIDPVNQFLKYWVIRSWAVQIPLACVKNQQQKAGFPGLYKESRLSLQDNQQEASCISISFLYMGYQIKIKNYITEQA